VAGFTGAQEFKLVLSVKPQNTQEIIPNFSPSLEAAYAPIDHLVLLVAFHSVFNRQVLDQGWVVPEESAKVNGYAFEAGVGYFSTLGEKGHAEVSLLYGNSSIRRRATDQSYSFNQNFDASYHSVTIQPSLGVSTRRIMLHGGLRYMLRNYYDITWHDVYYTNPIASLTNTLGLFVNFESAGDKLIRFNMQGGVTTSLQDSNKPNPLAAYCTLGLALRLAPRERGYMNW
jgi:hypothetical protein